MSNHRILFHAAYNFNTLTSGSRVRPYQMYQAFLNLGYEVDLIAGDVSTRKTALKKVMANCKKYNFCYSEPSSYPVHPVVDYQLYLYLKKREINTGIFYRDAYWKFSDYFTAKGIKKIELLARYKADLCLYQQTASCLFFPTDSLAKLFSCRTYKQILPPAGKQTESATTPKTLTYPIRAIYVGGITHRYGLDILLQSFHQINQTQPVFLDLVCRPDELDSISQEIKSFLNYSWLTIHHTSGKGLEPLYQKAHFGIIPRYKDSYNDLAMPVKLFEYLSFELPIIVTDCYEMSQFVIKNCCGIVCEDNSKSLTASIKKLIGNHHLYKNFSERALQTVTQGNTWQDRANSVVNILSKNIFSELKY